MLTTPRRKTTALGSMLDFVTAGSPPPPDPAIATGALIVGNWNPELSWDVHDGPLWDHPLFQGDDGIPSYCVVDTPQQFLERYGERLDADPEPWCVFFVHIAKVPGEEGGWRWHKWGPYIGDGEPSREYLADEAGFDDGVYTADVHRVVGR